MSTNAGSRTVAGNDSRDRREPSTKAIVRDRYDPPDLLELRDIERPTPTTGTSCEPVPGPLTLY